MERVKLYCQGQCRGEVVFQPEGGRTRVRASMADPGDGLYRAALAGEKGRLLLGVMEPENGELAARRTVYSRDLASLGQLKQGEAWRSFRFQESGWQEARRPAQLFQSRFLRSRLESIERAWQRRDGELLLLALPLTADGPFPLEALFCLARVERVEGQLCVVYAFRGEEPELH